MTGIVLAAALLSMERMSLDGLWDFHFESGKKTEEVRMPDFKADDKMLVPGCWTTESAYYDCRGTGCYRRRIDVEKAAEDAYLVVDGVGLRARFWIDGRDVGAVALPWSRFEVPIGSLGCGEHELVVAVDNMSDPDKMKLFSDFYDFYPYGGIFHGVELFLRRQATEVKSVTVRTRDYKTGRVELELAFAGKCPEAFDADVSFDGGERKKVAFVGRKATLEVPAFKLWSPESPHLHRVRVELVVDADRQEKSFAEVQFGIRQVSADGGRIMLNGEPIYLKGANRHESHGEFGAATPKSLMYEDLHNMKLMGMNFVRGSHYPQCDAFLSLCDEMGMLVWEESLGWGNRTNQLEDAEFQSLQEEQTRLMVKNSVNHPSVIISGFLNELNSSSEASKGIVNRLVTAIREEDSGHLVAYACNRVNDDVANIQTDIIAYNVYPGWYTDRPKIGSREELRKTIRDCHRNIVRFFRRKYGDSRPIVVSESGVKADFGFRDSRGRAQYTEDYQAEYTQLMIEEILANRDIAGFAIWLYADAKSYTRVHSLTARPYGYNTGGLYDAYRRPKLAVETVRKLFREFAR